MKDIGKIAGLSLTFILISTAVFAEPETAATSAATTPAPTASAARPSWFPQWEKAKGLESKGSYLEAQKIYESLLREGSLGRHARAIRNQYEALNLKLLLSSIETPDSLIYTIAPGDTLGKLAKKFGTTIELIQKSNRFTGDRIYIGQKLKINKSQFSILIKKEENSLTLLADGKPLKKYKVATGANHSTPVGVFKIVNKLKNPTWFHAGAIVPPDSPDNILGSRWLGFDSPGYGIHGTTLPETIGKQASKGCVRMLNAEVEELYDLIPSGTQVTVED